MNGEAHRETPQTSPKCGILLYCMYYTVPNQQKGLQGVCMYVCMYVCTCTASREREKTERALDAKSSMYMRYKNRKLTTG